MQMLINCRHSALALSLLALMASAQAQKSAPAVAATPAAATTTPSGLQIRMLKEGTGPSPKAEDVVRVHYRGTTPEGKEFDSSYSRGQPAQFPLNRVIKCWTEGVQMMKVGAKAQLICPPGIAYGERGAGNVIGPNATLHFEVELLGIVGK